MEQSPSDTIMDVQAIRKILPHRYPFVLVDRVLEIQRGAESASQLGGRIRALKNVTINEPFFPGHFPHRPVMPGVLLIEAMAQASALLVYDPEQVKQDVAIVAVNNAKFRVPVVPGDSVELISEVIRDRRQMFVFKCEARVGGARVAEAEIMAKMFDLDEGALT